MSENID